MNWKDLGPIVGAIAPTAGSILGGLIPFPGGSIIGQKFGELIASAFGVAPTPEAVAGAIAGSPNEVVLAKIQDATERARVEISGFVEMEKAVQETIRTSITETGQTMRLEILPENRHWFFTGGRAAAMWVLVSYLAALALLAVIATLMAFDGNAVPLKVLAEAWPLHLAIIGPLALVVGVYIRSPDARSPTVSTVVKK